MKLYEILTLIAIFIGPVLAVQVEKFLERKRNSRNRKIDIFKILMATRGSALSSAHVEALNRIDLEFSNNSKFKKVILAWKEYFDNLGQKYETEDKLSIWLARNEELLANLLYEMGQSLGFNFDKILIKRNIYSPVGHAKIEREQEQIRTGILDILKGEFPLQMKLVMDEEALQKQSELNNLIMQYYKKKLENN
ncbi:DUF6680 family protein [Sphingobacterium sp.]|uniref:DUF6680 family protein n=1 Tax=Sphingobacterium sp. TaxID=341027 RepID=UPI0028972706|nr:DUF6680 family protein [Sphingobacterium sp.]